MPEAPIVPKLARPSLPLAVAKAETTSLPSAPKTMLDLQKLTGFPTDQNSLPRAERLSLLRNHIGNCTRCALHSGRKNIVFGVGDPETKLMIVGEGPGADEDTQGEPFVGKAGQLLNLMLAAIALPRSSIYIANVVKCRPPGNRDPEATEVEACAGFLANQIAIIRPKLIMTLGKHAAHVLLQTSEPISKLRGNLKAYGDIPVLPTFHPAFLLRNPAMKRQAWKDLKAVRTMLNVQPPGEAQ